MIQAQVRRAGLLDIVGEAGDSNIHGESRQKLDVYANEALLHCLSVRESVAMLASEENDKAVTFERAPDEGKYLVVFDPPDDSSNIDVNVSVGTIFSILRRERNDSSADSSLLQPGVKQVAAGHVVYGSSTILVYTAGRGVFDFTLDPVVGAYILNREDMRMPRQGGIYSVNEACA